MKYKSLLSLILILSTVGLISAQDLAKGYVFEDRNANGKKERRENGIPGVSVTNGIDVVQTDQSGKYELSVSNDARISVIKPSGYSINVSDDQLAQSYYIHKPQGSPESEFKGVAPTGKLPRQLNFGLSATDDTDEFTSLIFGDPQPYNLQEVDYFARGIVSEL